MGLVLQQIGKCPGSSAGTRQSAWLRLVLGGQNEVQEGLHSPIGLQTGPDSCRLPSHVAWKGNNVMCHHIVTHPDFMVWVRLTEV